MPRREVLVAFDTPSDRRRRLLTRLLSRHGVRVQRSVFRLLVSEPELERLWAALERVCLPEEDLLLLGQITPGSWRQFGPSPPLEDQTLVVM